MSFWLYMHFNSLSLRLAYCGRICKAVDQVGLKAKFLGVYLVAKERQ